MPGSFPSYIFKNIEMSTFYSIFYFGKTLYPNTVKMIRNAVNIHFKILIKDKRHKLTTIKHLKKINFDPVFLPVHLQVSFLKSIEDKLIYQTFSSLMSLPS